MRNFSQNEHARGTFQRIIHARGTSHRINMHQELLTVSTCKRNFSQDQHARGTSYRINMQEDLLTRSAYGSWIISLDVKLYRLLSISPILLLSIFPFFHYCQLFSYYSILFTSVVNCLEPWIYAWLSLFQTTHDLRFKDLHARWTVAEMDQTANNTFMSPRWNFWQHSPTWQFVLSRDTSDITVSTSDRNFSQDQNARRTHF